MYNINAGYGARTNSLPFVTGKIFLVCQNTIANYDTIQELWPIDPEGVVRLHSTIQSAIDASVANRGDLILVAPGHATTITAAGGLDLNKAGVRILGLGEANIRPTITFTTVISADMDIDAANVTLENFIIDLTGFDALTAPIDVNAAGFTLQGCTVRTGSASAQAVLGILTDANADRLAVRNCRFIGTTDAGTAAAIRIVGGSEHIIENNYFYGAYTTTLGAIDNATTACLRTIVQNNTIVNATASSTKAMVFVAGSTGFIRGNTMQILSGTAPITGAGMSWAGANYYANAVATAGTLI